MAQAKHDNNHVPTILGVSATDSSTPVPIEADAATKSLKVTIAGGSSSGTEYTEGDVDATMSGGAIVFKGSGNTATVPSSTNPLPTSKWQAVIPANSSITESFRTPLAGTAATAWNFDPGAATTTVYCTVSGFKSKV